LYSGGTVLSTLLRDKDSTFKDIQFYALVRKQEHADAVKKLGVEPVLFNGLEDTEQIRKISADYDGEYRL
jgi:hypothetical protein